MKVEGSIKKTYYSLHLPQISPKTEKEWGRKNVQQGSKNAVDLDPGITQKCGILCVIVSGLGLSCGKCIDYNMIMVEPKTIERKFTRIFPWTTSMTKFRFGECQAKYLHFTSL